MVDFNEIDAVVFDVLGTLVDEPGGLHTAIGVAAPQLSHAEVDALVAEWQQYVEAEQRRMAQGTRRYANTEVVDFEAAQRVADRVGLTDPTTIAALATASQRLTPWHDSVAALEQLALRFPVIGLSNASSTALLRLGAHAGLPLQHALSGESVSAYKPAAEVYRLAVETARLPPRRVLMVAAHAWDLRGAQAIGMSTAYVERPGGDPPAGVDAFDWEFDELTDLVGALMTAAR